MRLNYVSSIWGMYVARSRWRYAKPASENTVSNENLRCRRGSELHEFAEVLHNPDMGSWRPVAKAGDLAALPFLVL